MQVDCRESGLVLLDDDGGVVAAETEGVAQSGANRALLCFVEGEVEGVVDFLVVVALLVVDGGGARCRSSPT